MIRGQSSDFERKVRQFYRENTHGRVMMVKDHTSAEATWHKGMVFKFDSGHPFLLSVIQDWYRDNPNGVIGDVEGLLLAKGEEGEYEMEERKRASQRVFQRQRCKIELHNILRKQNRIRKDKD